MAVHTNTFYPEPPLVSFTATVATVSGTGPYPLFIQGPGGGAGVQGEYILQAAGIYRWLKDVPMPVGVAALTAYSYVRMADDPTY